MTVNELIEKLKTLNPHARVFTGYDSNVCTDEAGAVEYIQSEDQIGSCWWGVETGDVVILARQ